MKLEVSLLLSMWMGLFSVCSVAQVLSVVTTRVQHVSRMIRWYFLPVEEDELFETLVN